MTPSAIGDGAPGKNDVVARRPFTRNEGERGRPRQKKRSGGARRAAESGDGVRWAISNIGDMLGKRFEGSKAVCGIPRVQGPAQYSQDLL